MGDFNLPGVHWVNGLFPSNHEYIHICNSIFENCLLQVVDAPTRKGNILDLILVNDPLITNLVDCPPIGNSDHNSIEFDLLTIDHALPNTNDNIDDTPSINPIVWRDFANADWSVLRAALRSVDWQFICRV